MDGATVDLIMTTMTKFKKVMKTKGLRAARANCPREGCGGILHATLNGKKDHMHCACSTEKCPIRFME